MEKFLFTHKQIINCTKKQKRSEQIEANKD